MVGPGWVAGAYRESFRKRDDIRVAYVVGQTREEASAFADKHGLDCPCTARLDDALGDSSVDIVGVYTPHNFHAPIAIAAARAGKHMIIEKPLGLYPEELKAMRAAVRDAGVKTIVGFVLRWNPLLKIIRRTITDGQLGRIIYAETDYLHGIVGKPYTKPWHTTRETGGTSFLLGGCHAIDAIRFLVGRPVVEVTAYSTSRTDGLEYPSTELALLKFDDGSIGKVGCFSFQQYKIITSGEGGLVATDDAETYDRARMQHDSAARFWEGVGSHKYNYVISGENYRLSELSAALVLAQTGRLDPLLKQFRAVKKRIVAGAKDIAGITLQDVPNPEGDCGITFTFFTPSADLAKRFSAALNAENIQCGTIYDNRIPDRHVYSNWPFMMSGLAEDRRAPWKSPYYEGAVRGYSPTECPQSLGYLGRAVMIFIDQFFTLQDADLVVEGISKVAKAIL